MTIVGMKLYFTPGCSLLGFLKMLKHEPNLPDELCIWCEGDGNVGVGYGRGVFVVSA